MRATKMSMTTFTIESVHGVKQTLVLNPPVKTAESDPKDPQSSDREAGTKSTATSPRSPR
jgi:hypothetical protein